MSSLITVDRFYANASRLRGVFDDRFADPLKAHPNRFSWDYWNVPDQYRLIRTPAYLYFPQKMYVQFHRHLVEWGRANLGCHDVSPTWLSYYVDGCYQNMHADVPHGPWAFVYSLSPPKPKYRGGETFLMNDRLLNYWTSDSLSHGHEAGDFSVRVPAKFNRLTVFDPRIPHGVTRVEGVDDPRDARLVLHGWFVEPRPYVEGALRTRDVDTPLAETVFEISSELSERGLFHGALSLRIAITPTGRVRALTWLTDTVRQIDGPQVSHGRFRRVIESRVKAMKLPARKGASTITLPLLFK